MVSVQQYYQSFESESGAAKASMVRAYFGTGSGGGGSENLQDNFVLEIVLCIEANPPFAVSKAFGSFLSGAPSAMEVWVGGDGIVVLSGGWRLRGWANASSAIDRSADAKTSWIPAASWLYYD